MLQNYLTIDVEDYYQVAAFEEIVSPNSWPSMESRIEKNTKVILDLFEKKKIRATFFIVGWIAERHPNLIKEIAWKGHEIGCHSYWHRKIYNLTRNEFREDTRKAKTILEEITGNKVLGYRAPSYSITNQSLWALDILAELGFDYDSSIFPVYHDNYGIPNAPRFEYKIPNHSIKEYPISTFPFLGQKIPVAGGGYFRFFPYWFIKMALQRINSQEKMPFVFYLHPWEIDPEQPRFNGSAWFSTFRHYNNLDKTYNRLEQLIEDFKFGPLPVDHNS